MHDCAESKEAVLTPEALMGSSGWELANFAQ